jgi:predicted lipid carrier protein YhbT
MSLLAGRRFEVRILDAGMTLRFGADDAGFKVDTSTDEPDLRFSANAADFARMMLREEDPDTLFFNRKLMIEGDTELGLIVKNLLDSVDWSGTPVSRFMAV